MSVAAIESTAGLPFGKADVAKVRELSPRTRVLLQGPIVPTLLRMAWMNGVSSTARRYGSSISISGPPFSVECMPLVIQ